LTEPRLPQRQPVRTGRRGLVTLELVIDTWGRVVQVYPLDSSEGFNQAIGDAIAQWRYEPTRLDGELVPVILTMTVLR
jgi:outer membrane biosynthesis protein TonB